MKKDERSPYWSTAKAADHQRRVLDPIERGSEVLFGLIMVLTFTLSVGATEAGRSDATSIISGALGCNFAWGVIDAVMYLMAIWGQRGLNASAVSAIRDMDDITGAQQAVADALPPLIRPALTSQDLERIRRYLQALPDEKLHPHFERIDVVGALGVFLIVFFCLFPVVAPLLLIQNTSLALRTSNLVALALLFFTGLTVGRRFNRPWTGAWVTAAAGAALALFATIMGGERPLNRAQPAPSCTAPSAVGGTPGDLWGVPIRIRYARRVVIVRPLEVRSLTAQKKYWGAAS